MGTVTTTSLSIREPQLRGDHGEVPARWADSDDQVEGRQGTATFDFDDEVIVIDDGITEHAFAMDQIVSWEKPMNVYESDG